MTQADASPSRPLRILIADDHPFLRRGIADVVEDEGDMEVVAEAADGEEAMRIVESRYPRDLDLVLMDLDMPGVDGLTATRRLIAEFPDLPIVILTVSSLERDLFESIRAGAIGYLSKSLSPEAMVRALRDYHHEGLLPMSGAMARKLLTEFRQAAPGRVPFETGGERETPTYSLTLREQEVLDLIASGARDKDIAERLVLTESTVKKHVQNILRKLDARNRTQAVMRHQKGAA